MPAMLELPPAELVYDALQKLVIPSAGAAALALGLFLLLGRWAGALGSGAAVVAGFAFANWHQKAPLLPWTPGDRVGRDWLMPSAALLVAVGLLSRWGGLIAHHFVNPSRWWWAANAVVWVPRATAVLLVSGWGLPAELATEEPNLRWLVAAGTLLAWVAFDGVARAGCSNEAVALLALAAACSGGVMIFAHSGKYLDIGTMLGMALFGVAVVGAVGKADVSGAIPAALGFLPGFVAGGRFVTTSNVPVESFWLAGLAPLALLPFLVPALARQSYWPIRLVRLLLVLAPLAAALFLANYHDPLKFDAAW
jgi:hypothetical protein